jgi:hypothetical protein
MGNKRSRNLTRPKERGKPCKCDIFDLSVRYDGYVLNITLITDLPVNTRIAVKAHRMLSESDGHPWNWTCLDDSLPVTPQENGLNGFVLRMTSDELDLKGCHMYRHLHRTMNVTIFGAPSKDLQVGVTAPATSHRFGICNRGLTGQAVTVRPSGHAIERSVRVDVPVSAEVLKQMGL